MEALGRLFNIASVIPPIDLASGAQTGTRVRVEGCSGVAFVYFAEAGTAGEDVDLDVQQHTAASGGTTADLDVVTRSHPRHAPGSCVLARVLFLRFQR